MLRLLDDDETNVERGYDSRSKEVFDAGVIEERDIVDSCPVYQVKGVSVLNFEWLLTALDAGMYVIHTSLHAYNLDSR